MSLLAVIGLVTLVVVGLVVLQRAEFRSVFPHRQMKVDKEAERRTAPDRDGRTP